MAFNPLPRGKRVLDVTFRPEGDAKVLTLFPDHDMRVYTSSVPGHLSVAMRGHTGHVFGGSRINVKQAIELRKVLDQFLELEGAQ